MPPLCLLKRKLKLIYCLYLQVKNIFGYSRRPNPDSTSELKLPQISFPRHDPVQLQLKDLLGPIWTPYFQWREFVMGLAWLAILFTMKEVGKRNKFVSSSL